MIKKRPRGNLSSNSGAKARRKGHNFERLIRKRLLPLFPKCQTSRYASKKTDDNGIDFVGTYPFVIQAKHVERGVNPQKILSEMIIEKGDIPTLFHKKKGYRPIAVMWLDDWVEHTEKMIVEKILNDYRNE
jgi:hypothetical protein